MIPITPISVADGRSAISRRDFVVSGLAALAAPALMGCGGSPTGVEPATRLSARPGTPTVTPTLGLSQLGLGGDRDGILYVPETYDPDTSTPLFVGLHGAGGSATDWESYFDRSEERGMVLLAPDSQSPTWDVLGGEFGPDVEFLNDALQHTFDRCRVNPTQIALGGFSDGASYALSLGLPNGDLFSHLIAYSPGFYVDPDDPVGQPRIYVSHGTQDTILPVGGTRNFIVPALRNEGYDVVYEEFFGSHMVPAVISESALDWFLGAG
jgi:phospholipase/carboxylesterase